MAKKYEPSMQDLLAVFAMMIHKEGGKIVVKRDVIEKMNNNIHSKIDAIYHSAEDVVVITLECKLASGIVLPSGGIIQN